MENTNPKEEPTTCECGANTSCQCGPEEPKQETQGYICPHTKLQCDDECCVSAEDCHIKTTIGIISEPKQETLEEAATNYTIDFATMSAFKLGAKWQQEQDKNKFSEEDMMKAVKFGELYKSESSKSLFEKRGTTPTEVLKKWFEQIKKK